MIKHEFYLTRDVGKAMATCVNCRERYVNDHQIPRICDYCLETSGGSGQDY